MQARLCQVGLRDLLLCSNCGPHPNQNHVDQKPGKYKDTDWNLLVWTWLVKLIFLSKFTKVGKRDEKFSFFFINTTCANMGLPSWIEGLTPAFNCGPFPDQNHVDQKSRNYKKVRLKHFFYLFRFELFFQNLQREKRGRWIVQTASFVSSLYLCKHGFAKLDWGTSSCVLIVGPSQTKTMSTKNPENTKKTDWNISILLA